MVAFKSGRIYRNRRSDNFFINEGLIKSYEYNKVKHYLLHKFKNIKNIDFALRHPLNNKGLTMNNAKHFMYISLNKNFNEYKKIEQVLNNLCGWYISKAIVYYHDLTFHDNNSRIIRYLDMDNIESGLYNDSEDIFLDNIIKDNGIKYKIIQIEFLAQEKFTKHVNDIPDILYHGTDIWNFNKICKNGLVPKNKNNHPERIYFGNSDIIIKQICHRRNNVLVLRINVNKKIKKSFYVDFNHDGCYYTTECIHPMFIEVLLDNGQWKSINNIINFDDVYIYNSTI